jgi:hypothetical protein
MFVVFDVLGQLDRSKSRMSAAMVARGEFLAVNDRYFVLSCVLRIVGNLIYARNLNSIAGLIGGSVHLIIICHYRLLESGWGIGIP